eukprot:TRINITY_DN91516_c0_g1_i1.p1 TRINITY_DN91516_c0_g1~~TRINITY_DN91516_c0_g1_i1.p1  ORF type:complete len:494 (-),score=87.43 TRINITY_DN91516_c0_g1_i1:23-1504(-)
MLPWLHDAMALPAPSCQQVAERRWAHGRSSCMGRLARRHLGLLVLISQLPAATSKWVDGTVSLGPRQAKVVTKFCFDFNPVCEPEKGCPQDAHPGLFKFNISKGRRLEGARDLRDKSQPVIHVALLDDEYFSFPEVSQVWDELSCKDVLKAAKKTFLLNWPVDEVKGQELMSPLAEHIRPRWWYVAFVSCSPIPVELTYSAHLVNSLGGSRQELSLDEPGVREAFLLVLAFGAVATLHFQSCQRWSAEGRAADNHPVLGMLTLTVALAAVGSVGWLAYYWDYSSSGRSSSLWLLTGRLGLASARTLMQVLLLLLAQGDCVVSPGIHWQQNAEMVAGNCLFGALSFALEMYGDSQFQTTTTEYIYDTRPGTALVAFDVFWLWVFAKSSFQTVQSETRIKHRIFYRTYAPAFAVWFAALPMIATIARAVAPWLRFYVAFLVSGLLQALALGGLVWIFTPEVAPSIFELGFSVGYNVVGDGSAYDDMGGMMRDTDL